MISRPNERRVVAVRSPLRDIMRPPRNEITGLL